MAAARSAADETVIFLLSKGASPDLKNNKNQTALLYAIEAKCTSTIDLLATVTTKGLDEHPLPETTYTGVRTTVLGDMFFLSFLAETKRGPPFPGHFHCKFWPHSFHLA